MEVLGKTYQVEEGTDSQGNILYSTLLCGANVIHHAQVTFVQHFVKRSCDIIHMPGPCTQNFDHQQQFLIGLEEQRMSADPDSSAH